ncbi:hypothetical protein [Winogradskyella alexanderae]|uniref:Uncharacterized protein n=1 Tax=Winogradskyella alexanderae TaxID=2877123 RepID=A0ABS7XNY0_9FLAO|nr:hypothetical protein [Winogradskyella alexanderae]MCA0131703.1 hypothetical protein [Winogradskyella alexanderae]
MKKIFFTVILMSSIVCFSQETKYNNVEEIRQQQIENIHNPDLWDMERMREDIAPNIDLLPIKFSAFPVPYYDKLGPYKGGGFLGNTHARSVEDYKLIVEDKEVVFNSFFIGDSPFYKEENKNGVFFTIITVADSLDTNNYVPSMALISSRNHPDYGGEGSIMTKNNRIDYLAFTTPDKGSFAIINMRLFHLEHGEIIVIVPHKDGSLRSLQIQGKKVNDQEVFDYIKNEVLIRKDVVEILTEDGVI